MATISDEKLKLWFFRDISSEQRLKLFGLMGMPIDEIGDTHGHQQVAFRHIVQSLRSQAGVSEAVEGVIDQVLEAERYAPKIVPMGANPPLFDGMQLDNDGPWLNRVDVAKRLRAALQGETK